MRRLITRRDDATVVRHAFGTAGDMATELEALPDRVTALEVQISQFRAEVRADFSAARTDLRQEMSALEERLRQEMHALNSQTMTQTRVLHEDLLARFSLLDEHVGRKPSGRPRVAKTPRG